MRVWYVHCLFCRFPWVASMTCRIPCPFIRTALGGLRSLRHFHYTHKHASFYLYTLLSFKTSKVTIDSSRQPQGCANPFLDVDLDAARQMFDINFWAALYMIQGFKDLLIAARGVVANNCSMAAVAPCPYICKSRSAPLSSNDLSLSR